MPGNICNFSGADTSNGGDSIWIFNGGAICGACINPTVQATGLNAFRVNSTMRSLSNPPLRAVSFDVGKVAVLGDTVAREQIIAIIRDFMK